MRPAVVGWPGEQDVTRPALVDWPGERDVTRPALVDWPGERDVTRLAVVDWPWARDAMRLAVVEASGMRIGSANETLSVRAPFVAGHWLPIGPWIPWDVGPKPPDWPK